MNGSWKKFYRTRAFRIATIVVLATIVASVYARMRDKPLMIVSPSTADSEPDYLSGIGLDFKELYDKKRQENVLTNDENGWRLVLQSFGPDAFGLENRRGSWGDFADDQQASEWFENCWTPVCEAFDLDPNVAPTFYNRLDLESFLVKNGLSGTEPLLDSSDENSTNARYWEDGEEQIGRIAREKARECCGVLINKPWTSDDYPVPAQWFDENDDVFAVYEEAFRRPTFNIWKMFVLNDDPNGFPRIPTIRCVDHIRAAANLFMIRANYRLGKGDYSAAIDDLKTCLLIAKALLESNNRSLRDYVAGASVLRNAEAFAIFGRNETLPAAEDWARWEQVWDETFGDFDLKANAVESLDMAKLVALWNMQSVANFRRQGGVWKWGKSSRDESWFGSVRKFFAKRFVLIRGAYDDALFLRTFEELWRSEVPKVDGKSIKRRSGPPRTAPPTSKELEAALKEKGVDVHREKRKEKQDALRWFCSCESEGFLPNVDFAILLYRENACALRIRKLTSALLRYQAENGTLPPAFTVDENGVPSHSWRVLILPDLGEAEKALFNKIKLDEPWDSEYNRRFHDQAPRVFQCPIGRECGNDKASYSVVLDADGLFDDSGLGKNLLELCDRVDVDTFRQALVVERRTPVEWMRPDAELDLASCRELFKNLKEKPDAVVTEHVGLYGVGVVSGAVGLFSESSSVDEVIWGKDAQEPQNE